MTKLIVLLAFTFCLALQPATAFPRNVPISEESTEREIIKDNETELDKSTATTVQTTTDVATEPGTDFSEEIDSDSAEDFSYLLALYNTPTIRLILSTRKVVQYHLNTLITVGHEYFAFSLKALKELPNKTPTVEANIKRLTNLVERMEELDLSENNLYALLDKFELTHDLGDFGYAKLLSLLEIDDDVLSELYTTLSLRIKASLKENIKKLTKIFHNFFDELDEKEKVKYATLIKIYDDFKSDDMDSDKFNEAMLLLIYLLPQPV